MSEKKFSKKKFWEVLKEMGYPTSKRGLVYLSEDHKYYDKIPDVLRIINISKSGGKLGLGGAHLYWGYYSEYPDIFLLVDALYGKYSKKDLVKIIAARLKSDANHMMKEVKDIAKHLNVMRDWVKKGGLLNEDSVIFGHIEPTYADPQKLNRDGNMHRSIQRLRKIFERSYNEDIRRRWIGLAKGLELDQKDIEYLERTYEESRKKGERLIKELEAMIRYFCEEYNLDAQRVIDVLSGTREF